MFDIKDTKKEIFKTFIKFTFFLLLAIFFFAELTIKIKEYNLRFIYISFGILLFFINYLFILKKYKNNLGLTKFLLIIEFFIFNIISLRFCLDPWIKENSLFEQIIRFEFMIYYILIIHSFIQLYILLHSKEAKKIYISLKFLLYLFISSISFFLLGQGTDLITALRIICGIIFVGISLFYAFILYKQINFLIKQSKNINNTNKTSNNTNKTSNNDDDIISPDE